MNEKLFYIESIKHRRAMNNRILRNWWAPDRSGYTFSIDYAGKYTRQAADSICNGREKEVQAWPCEEIDAAAKRVIFLP